MNIFSVNYFVRPLVCYLYNIKLILLHYSLTVLVFLFCLIKYGIYYVLDLKTICMYVNSTLTGFLSLTSLDFNNLDKFIPV